MSRQTGDLQSIIIKARGDLCSRYAGVVDQAGRKFHGCAHEGGIGEEHTSEVSSNCHMDKSLTTIFT